MRIGLLGGTFDPIHCGHIAMADTAIKVFSLHAVYFVTAVNPPHKTHRTHANFLDRHAMVALALAGQPRMISSSLEFDRAGKSYSIDTVQQLRETSGHAADMFFLIGLDAFAEIASWKDYQRFLDYCSFIVFARTGLPEPALNDRLPDIFLNRMVPASSGGSFDPPGRNCAFLVREFANPISSTEIRRRLRQNEPIAGLVPPSVEEFICKTGLYQL